MDLPDPKQLKRLADYCRKAGIKVYECAECKITLDDHYFAQPTAYQKRKAKAEGPQQKYSVQNSQVPIDAPSAEELLFLSCGGPPDGFDPEDLPS